MFAAPERRISSWVITKIAAATCDILCSFLETEVTSMLIRVSILTCVRSPCGAVGTFAEEVCGHAGWQASKSVITSWHPARVSRRRFKVRLAVTQAVDMVPPRGRHVHDRCRSLAAH